MNFEPTDEQRLLADSIEGLLGKNYDANTRLALLSSDTGWNRDMWRRYAEQGLLGLTIDEQFGGAGMGAAELAVVMAAFGRALVLEPYFATVVLGAALVAAAGTPEQRKAVLPGVADGTTLLAFGYAEPASRWSLVDIGCRAEQHDGGWTLSGQKIAVVGGDSADQLVITARRDSGEVSLFLVDGDADALTRDAYAMQDGQRGADLMLSGVAAQPLGDVADAVEVIAEVVDRALAALCAEAVGAMETMLSMTVGYLKTRVQFGTPIAAFQVLQHRAADMYVAVEQARSMALVARLALEDVAGTGPDGIAERRRLIRAAKYQVDASARHVAAEAIQLHGGIGMTMEYPVGHYAKRTMVIAKTFADADLLLGEVGAGGGLIAAG